MTEPEFRQDGDDGRVPAPASFLRELIEKAVTLIQEAEQEPSVRAADYGERKARFLEIVEAVRRNG